MTLDFEGRTTVDQVRFSVQCFDMREDTRYMFQEGGVGLAVLLELNNNSDTWKAHEMRLILFKISY